jgi:hypothetical protein
MIRYLINSIRNRRALHERYAQFRNAYRGRTLV